MIINYYLIILVAIVSNLECLLVNKIFEKLIYIGTETKIDIKGKDISFINENLVG